MTAEDSADDTGNDVFYLRQARVSSVLSNLPRKKIPRMAEGTQPVTERVLTVMCFMKHQGRRRARCKI